MLKEFFRLKYFVVTFMVFYAFFGLVSYNLIDRPPLILGLLIVPFHFAIKLGYIKNFPVYLRWYGLFVLFELVNKYLFHDNDLLVGASHVFRSAMYLLSFFILLIVENTRFSRKFILSINGVLIPFLFFAMLISMVQFFDPEFFVNPRFKVDVLEGNHRVSSIFTWEGDEKGALFTVPILLAILITFKNRKLNWKDFFLLVFPVFIIVFLTGSRAAILNFSIVLFWYFRRNFSFTLIANIILSVILLFIALLALNFDFEFFINNRLQADTDSRLVIFEYVGIKIAESPLIGDGLGGVKGIDNSLGLTFGNRVHNGFLAVLLNYGFIGLFLFTGFIISWFFEMRRSARQTGFYGGLLTFYIFFVTNISVDITHFLWPGLTLAIVYKKYQDDHKKSFYENTIHLNR